jgi:hypothetical protein
MEKSRSTRAKPLAKRPVKKPPTEWESGGYEYGIPAVLIAVAVVGVLVVVGPVVVTPPFHKMAPEHEITSTSPPKPKHKPHLMDHAADALNGVEARKLHGAP